MAKSVTFGTILGSIESPDTWLSAYVRESCDRSPHGAAPSHLRALDGMGAAVIDSPVTSFRPSAMPNRAHDDAGRRPRLYAVDARRLTEGGYDITREWAEDGHSAVVSSYSK